MSGPSLERREAHHAIHQAAFDEAEQLTRLLRQAILARAPEHAAPLVGALIEHWQTRTLRHAEAEEAGWYREVVAARPDRRTDVIALTRDHDLLRILLAEVQGILARHGTLAGVLERFEAMLLINAIHSREEERRLLGDTDRQDVQREPGTAPPGTAPPAPPDAADAPAGPIPLALARPALYARLLTSLDAAGAHPGDLAAEVVRGPSGPALRVRSGPAFARTREWPLPEDETGVAALLDEAAAFCAAAAEEAYRRLMQPPP